EHVAHAEQLFRALLAQNRARVDLRRHLEGDAGREVSLDRTGNDVDRRALGGHDDMDARGAGRLGDALYRGCYVLAGDHHQVGHLVDDGHDPGHGLVVAFLRLVARLARLPVETRLYRSADGLALLGSLRDPLVEAVNVSHAA